VVAGKVVLVTGAASGAGEAVARALVWRGARVGLYDGDAAALAGLERELDYPESGGRALALAGSVASLSELRQAVTRLEASMGPVWALVYCSGAEHPAPVWEVGEESWERVRAANLDGAFYATRAVLPTMLARSRGNLVYVGSLLAETPASSSASAASKAGLQGLAAAARRDLRPRGVRVSLILSGGVRPSDVAETVVYVLESDAGFTPATIELIPQNSGPAS